MSIFKLTEKMSSLTSLDLMFIPVDFDDGYWLIKVYYGGEFTARIKVKEHVPWRSRETKTSVRWHLAEDKYTFSMIGEFDWDFGGAAIRCVEAVEDQIISRLKQSGKEFRNTGMDEILKGELAELVNTDKKRIRNQYTGTSVTYFHPSAVSVILRAEGQTKEHRYLTYNGMSSAVVDDYKELQKFVDKIDRNHAELKQLFKGEKL